MSSVIAKLVLPADEFALRRTFQEYPNAVFEIERIAAHGADRVLPLIWLIEDDIDGIETAVCTDPSVENLKRLSEVSDRRLYTMDWIENIQVIVRILVKGNGAILNAVGKHGHWMFRILFPTRDGFDETIDFCETNGLTLDIRSIHEMTSETHGRFGLDEKQHETLTAAAKAGYFDVPRKIEIQELAEDFDVTHQALSKRLRRAQRDLTTNALLIDRDHGGDNSG